MSDDINKIADEAVRVVHEVRRAQIGFDDAFSSLPEPTQPSPRAEFSQAAQQLTAAPRGPVSLLPETVRQEPVSLLPQTEPARSAPSQGRGDFTAYHRAGDALNETVRAYKDGDLDMAAVMRDEFLKRMEVLDAHSPGQFTAAADDFMNRLNALGDNEFLNSVKEGLTHIAEAPGHNDPVGNLIRNHEIAQWKPGM